jgi:hypothetical protein
MTQKVGMGAPDADIMGCRRRPRVAAHLALMPGAEEGGVKTDADDVANNCQ